ncbi:Transposon Ty3-I Gag-Pol polyprotein [Araneus ventricosus]|uniref:Transposon Ty3-I Gag-Pol polyprotein n=1 Tax=Araneus ventricosus TaxID=182803 RepID=A0A4Y2IW71_ARAVE|nr:Transposon Ty3-I Gag-Pol polyprotein [Araneus ventricosus]
MSEYSHVFSKNKYDVRKIRIEPTRMNLTSDLPVSQRASRTSATEDVEINKQIKNLLTAGLIKESNSCYSSPVTLAYKRDEMKKTRLCIDYRKLNAICKTGAEALPRIDTLLDKLTNAKIFSTLDLASGYWHIPLHEKDKEKLAFVISEDLYEFQVLPFGSRNAPAIFNRTIRRILNKHKCSTFARHYFDDIVIFSNSLEEHYAYLEQIFKMCEEENIKLKFSKCVFAKDKINFLGYEIKEGCITPDNHNIEIKEARKLAKQNTIKYHDKNKIKYDARFIDSPFKADNIVMYEEFNYPNRRKLSPVFSGPYEIVKKRSDVNYEITKSNALTEKPTEIVHTSKLRTFYPPEKLKLSHG